MCPFKTDSCGNNDVVLLKNAGDKQTLSLSLNAGDVCVYNVKALCGVPAFKPTVSSYLGLKGYSIDYEDYDVETESYSNATRGPASQIYIPIENTPITPDEINANYYNYDYVSYQLANGTYLYSYMDYSGTFLVV